MSKLGPSDPAWWTEARKEQARAFWTAERRAFEAMKRKFRPQGMYSSAWWTAEKRAEQAERLRRHHARSLGDVEAAFEQAERARRVLRGGS